MTNADRILGMAEISLAVYLIALVLGYGWVRSAHYPFTVRQRKMLTYYALSLAVLPVLGPLTVALARWLLPESASMAIGAFLFLTWMVIAFYIVRWMSRPGGRLGQERQE